MVQKTTRREFLNQGAAAGFGLWVAGAAPAALGKSANSKLNIAMIGAGGRARADLQRVSSQNIVALCDVDENRASWAFNHYSNVPKYKDFRRMLDKEDKNIDAVVVATPDHTHAIASITAMKMGKHCYCEKPLTWSIHESRVMAKTARDHGVVTQMGNQGSAASGFRRGVEALRAGVIGTVREVHVWTNRPVWPQPVRVPNKNETVPDGLSWKLWQTVTKHRPYHKAYLPFTWRGWYDYGTGALGDMACHIVNLPYRGLQLTIPHTVEAETTERYPESYPAGSRITSHYPARMGLPAVKLTWYDGSYSPPGDVLPKELWDTDRRGNKHMPGNGALMIGDKGMMYSGSTGTKQRYLPEELGETEIPRLFPRTPGHHYEWIQACKGEGATFSNFQFSAPFVESILLGNVAVRTGKTIHWNRRAMHAEGVPEADPLINRHYYNGYSL